MKLNKVTLNISKGNHFYHTNKWIMMKFKHLADHKTKVYWATTKSNILDKPNPNMAQSRLPTITPRKGIISLILSYCILSEYHLTVCVKTKVRSLRNLKISPFISYRLCFGFGMYALYTSQTIIGRKQ